MGKNYQSKLDSAASRTLVGGLPALEIQLLRAKEEYQDGPDGGRSGIIRQLKIADEILRALLGKKATGLLLPMRSVIAGLVALDLGRTQEFLKAKPKQGRPNLSPQRGAMQGCLAATFKILVQEGLLERDAIKKIEDKLKGTGFISNEVDGLKLRTIRSWQTKAVEKPSSHLGKGYHSTLMANFTSKKEAPKDTALNLLAALIKTSRLKDIS